LVAAALANSAVLPLRGTFGQHSAI